MVGEAAGGSVVAELVVGRVFSASAGCGTVLSGDEPTVDIPAGGVRRFATYARGNALPSLAVAIGILEVA
jgi:hypothetical protein